jgi:hypothetical protein
MLISFQVRLKFLLSLLESQEEIVLSRIFTDQKYPTPYEGHYYYEASYLQASLCFFLMVMCMRGVHNTQNQKTLT